MDEERSACENISNSWVNLASQTVLNLDEKLLEYPLLRTSKWSSWRWTENNASRLTYELVKLAKEKGRSWTNHTCEWQKAKT